MGELELGQVFEAHVEADVVFVRHEAEGHERGHEGVERHARVEGPDALVEEAREVARLAVAVVGQDGHDGRVQDAAGGPGAHFVRSPSPRTPTSCPGQART